MLFRRNSSLIALDKSLLSNDNNEFSFLPFVQDIQITSNLNKISQKSLGSDLLNKKFYTNPDLNLNINLIQENNFLLEFLLGFSINGSLQTEKTILNNFSSKSINSCIMLFDDKMEDDIIFKLKNDGYSTQLTSFVFKKLFLNSYNFSYSVGNLPISSLSFSFDDVKVSKLINVNNKYLAQSPNGQDIELQNSWINSFYYKTNFNLNEKINTTAVNFKLSTNYSEIEIPSSDFSELESSNVTSLDFSLDFQRDKFFFFEKGASPHERPYFLPCIAKLSIQGLTSKFNEKSLSSLKDHDSKFFITLNFGKSGLGLNYSEIKFENITIDSFSYSMSTDNFLNYSIECSVEINEKSGLKFTLLEVSDQDENFIKIHSSDGHKLSSADGDLVILA